MSDVGLVRSDCCGLDELFLAYGTGDAERGRLALDFAGLVEEVLPQPFMLRFGTVTGQFRRHVPDFLAVFRDRSRWLFDVRPAELVEEEDATCFAAAAEAALEAGWRYSVVAGWRPHVLAAIDAMSAQRRDLADRLVPRLSCVGRFRVIAQVTWRVSCDAARTLRSGNTPWCGRLST